ncbi:MAG: restriction endonuclease subunit S [Eggerthellaceae bacterium]|nr:restriction endonuclease subunit S [Eggerthellaceae bacterium]
MTVQTKKLSLLCSIKAGYPSSRIIKTVKETPAQTSKVLIPRAIDDGCIVETELTTEQVGHIKDDFYTHEGDVVLKLSTPYDCVYIDKTHEGILVTSFAVILRPLHDTEIDMRYLAAFLNTAQAKRVLQSHGTGLVIPLLKKSTLEDVPIPLVSYSRQQQLAQIFENVQQQKANARKLLSLGSQLVESEFASTVYGTQ